MRRFAVFIYGGLRRQEALDLKLDDVDLREKCIIVRQGKGRKARTIYPHADCMSAIRDLLSLRPRDCSHDWLFALTKGRRLADQGLHTMIEQIKAISGVDRRVVPHSLRHNCATRLLRAGCDLESLRCFLGHSSLAVSAIYLHSDLTRQREIAKFGQLASFSPADPPAAPNKQARQRRISKFHQMRRQSR